jgi:uncharacterized protein (DUF885 family)
MYGPLVVEAVQTKVYPCLRSYSRFLKEEYLRRAQNNAKPGLCHLPGGEAAYDFCVRRRTTLEKSSKEIHKTGLEELRKIHEEMAQTARRMGFKTGLPETFDRLRRDPSNFFAKREEILAVTRKWVEKTKKRLPEFFGKLPKTGLEVRPTEAYLERNDPAARYLEPPEDLSRPGIYYVNTFEPKSRPRFSLPAMTAHEGLPGHHLQIALALEARNLPAFQRGGRFTAFIEGWALYAERLADEMGLYEDDMQRLGMLTEQAWRAVRLVVDTGIHALGWSRQKAIKFMKDSLPLAESEIITEVDRYIIWPGQALAYMMGKLEIEALRREVTAKSGKNFDLRAFHDKVLENGPLPLKVLREVVKGRMLVQGSSLTPVSSLAPRSGERAG